MVYETISVEKNSAHWIVRLNRPADENRLTVPLMYELTTVLQKAKGEQRCRSVILAAAGDVFCGGGYLGDFPNQSSLAIRDFTQHFVTLHKTIHTLPKPIIAAVQGDVKGGGFTLIEVCDLVVAANTARFSIPEILFGLSPMMSLVGAFQVLPKKKLMELAFLGKALTADEAKHYGMVNWVSPRENVLERAGEVATEIETKNPTSIDIAKSLSSNLTILEYTRQLELAATMLVTMLKTEDAAEAYHAQQEGRPPVWSGK